MKEFLSIIFVAFAILLLILFLFYKGIKLLYKKGYKKSATTVVISVLLLIFFEIYIAIYPTDSFYKENFEADLSTHFPNNATIISKDATYPDIHGRYLACCAIELEQKDFIDLKTRFAPNFKIDSVVNLDPYNKIMEKYKKNDVLFVHYDTTKKSTVSYLLFLKDNKTIVFYHSLW